MQKAFAFTTRYMYMVLQEIGYDSFATNWESLVFLPVPLLTTHSADCLADGHITNTHPP